MSAQSETAEAFTDLLEAGSNLGLGVLSLVGGVVRDLAPPRGHRRDCRCGCHIPTPCWEPQPLGTFATRGCPGAHATLRVRVTNCGSTNLIVTLEGGAGSSGLVVQPGQLSLTPQARGYSVLSFDVPAGAQVGDVHEFLVWIAGCKRYFLRWRVRVASKCGGDCPDVDVDDCPDLIHHWYDHFYCEHPCQPTVKR